MVCNSLGEPGPGESVECGREINDQQNVGVRPRRAGPEDQGARKMTKVLLPCRDANAVLIMPHELAYAILVRVQQRCACVRQQAVLWSDAPEFAWSDL